jgi:hypothetical protein
MRAPQYGHHKGKRRTNNAAVPAKPRLWRAVGLRGPNEPVPTARIRYQPPKMARYEDGTLGAPCTLTMWHKNATWLEGKRVGSEGPTVTKRYAVLGNSHRGKGK